MSLRYIWNFPFPGGRRLRILCGGRPSAGWPSRRAPTSQCSPLQSPQGPVAALLDQTFLPRLLLTPHGKNGFECRLCFDLHFQAWRRCRCLLLSGQMVVSLPAAGRGGRSASSAWSSASRTSSSAPLLVRRIFPSAAANDLATMAGGSESKDDFYNEYLDSPFVIPFRNI